MKRPFRLAATLLIILALAAAGCDRGKAGGTVLTKQKASEAVKRLNPEIEVISVGQGPVEGLWEVVVKRGTSISVTYMDGTGDMLFLGNLVNTVEKVSMTEHRLGEILRVDPSEIPLEGSILLGNKDAPKTVFVFSDPECPYCALLHDEMKKAIEINSEVAFRIILVPIIKNHPSALPKSKAIMCAGSDEKSVAMLEAAFKGEEVPDPDCQSTAIEDNLKLLEKFSINGTPTIIFPDGSRFQGAVHADELLRMATGETEAGEPEATNPTGGQQAEQDAGKPE